MYLSKLFLPSMILVILSTVCTLSAVENKQVGSWKNMPLPPRPSLNDNKTFQGYRVNSLRVDKNGSPWAIIDKTLYCWDGSKFRIPGGSSLKQDDGSTFMFGGEDRDLYLVHPGKDPFHCDLYMLAEGNASLVTDCYLNRSALMRSVYVSKAGKLYNWGSRFLAVYSGGIWKRIETTLHVSDTAIFDTGESVYFLYNNNLCTVDKNDSITSKTIELPFKKPYYSYKSSALWGKESAIVVYAGEPNPALVNLRTGELSSLPEHITKYFDGLSSPRLQSLQNGDILAYSKTQNPSFDILTADGQIQSAENPRLAYSINFDMRYTDSLLTLPDGSFWFAAAKGGIIQVKKDRVVIHDLQSGAPMSPAYSVQLGKGNAIYAQTRDAIYVYDPVNNKKTQGTSKHWQEYLITKAGSVQDSLGRIWCFLADHPNQISCWDGRKWNHINFSGTIDLMQFSCTDDLGHLLVESPYSEKACYDVSLESIKKFDGIEDALLARVADGAKSFETYADYIGCVIDKENHIYLAHGRKGVGIWDGKKWEMFTELAHEFVVLESSKYGVLFSESFVYPFYIYDRGQLVSVDNSRKSPGKLLMGHDGIQPYDEELLQSKPYKYLVIERDDQGDIRIPKRSSTDNRRTGEYFSLNDRYRTSKILGRGYKGGFWLSQPLSSDVLYVLGGEAILCNLDNPPFGNGDNDHMRFYEDPQYNFWVDAGNYLEKNHLFMVARADARISFKNPPKTAIGSVVLDITTDNVPPDSMLFWRVDESQWNPADKYRLEVVFPGSGKHNVQIRAVDGTGATIAVSEPVQIESKQ